jgi:hypothetical protein
LTTAQVLGLPPRGATAASDTDKADDKTAAEKA